MSIQLQLKKLKDAPGIYLYFNAKKELIYVGKATSLKNRVRSYFVGKKTSRPIDQMVHQLEKIRTIETDSVLEAIILEAKYIKEFEPKYNVIGKDNKSWNYILITREAYPRIVTMRQHELSSKYGELRSKSQELRSKEAKKEFQYMFGPYPGLNTKATLKLLRQLFGFSTCKPDAKRPCMYYQMQQCRGVCTGEISVTEYKRQVIMPLVTFLKGGKKRVIGTFMRRMKKAAKEKRYEDAGRLRDQIQRLQRIHDIALLNKSFFARGERNYELGIKNYDIGDRIEGYDISNLGSTGKVGSMVVAEYGEIKKADYRKFKIKTVEGQSDVDCLEEVLRRRLKHDEWTYPSLFLIDGGKPQVNRVVSVLKDYGLKTPVVGIAKGPDRKKNEFIFGEIGNRKLEIRELKKWVHANQDVLIQVRDEAHRFAVAYQRKLRRIKK